MKGNWDADVAVVGGGPAGLTTAIAARQKGLSVLVIDCAQPPVDKACGEGIMPDGLEALAKFGVSLSPDAIAPFKGIRFVDRAGQVRADFAKGPGFGVRRPLLHSLLIEKAAANGVDLRWNTHVEYLGDHQLRLDGTEHRARYVIGADGINSKVRKVAGLEQGKIYRRRFGFRRHYAVAPFTQDVEVHWSDRAQMYVTPVSGSEVCVAMITNDQHLRFDDALPAFPELFERLQGIEPSTRLRGALTLTRTLKNISRNEVALVGDASGSPDAITGDGLSVSFKQAVVLADAIANDDLKSYQAAHRKILRLPLFMGELMLSMSDHPAFRKRVFAVFDRNPMYFQRLLQLHTTSASPLDFGVGTALSLGWRLLTV